MDGLAKGGLVTLFVGNGLAIFISILVFGLGLGFTVGAGASGVAAILGIMLVLCILLPILTILFGVLALTKKNDAFRITTGVLGLVSLFFVWAAWFFPIIINLVGSILTLCGKKNATE